jgi:hypothetical protein
MGAADGNKNDFKINPYAKVRISTDQVTSFEGLKNDFIPFNGR